ncbi:MAG: MFS transporter, partial [Gammaproteobacteria bacterium]|nr:MFS transporter [Gammaproteobacteria bacterium]
MGYGIQTVMFAWLVTMVLRESPEMVGLAQMTLLLPGMVLILVGGSYSDRFGGRRIAMAAQSVGALAPILLLALLWFDQLSFSTMLVYAVLMGCAQAFVTPARDGLLNQVAEGRVQRTVMLTSMVQFGLQMIGFLVASLADTTGPLVILATQSLILAIGVLGFARIPQVEISRPANPALLQSVIEGARTVLSSASMRMVVLQNVAMGMFFMGSYIVTMPLLVREVYDGSAQDLAFMNGANSFGLVLTILLLLRIGDVRRLGRALILSQGLGAAVLGCAALAQSFSIFVLALFFWGVCGGLAMTMSRTIMQEQAPDEQRGRVMSFYSFSFMGSGPIGALLSGYLVQQVGPQTALLICAGIMLLIMVIVGFTSSLWKLGEPTVAAPEAVG